MRYPNIRNSNFATRDDAVGRQVYEAISAVEAGETYDADLLDALFALEDALSEYAHTDAGGAPANELCAAAEQAVAEAWAEVRRHAL